MKKYIVILFVLFFVTPGFSQDVEKNKALAKHYYSAKNYEKAAVLYEELFNTEKNSLNYYSYLFNSLLRINEYEKLEKIIKKVIKKYKGQDRYLVDLGYVYSQNNEAEKGEKLYEDAINNLTANENKVRSIANKFAGFRLSEYIVKTYEKGNQLFKDPSKFAYHLGDAFIKLNKPKQAIIHWLTVLDEIPAQKSKIQSSFSRNLNKEGFQDALETQLYTKIQEKPNNAIYPELLIWLFTNQKDFENALIQAKALDKKQKEDGSRVMKLSKNALNEKDYSSAILGYDYVINKGEGNKNFLTAKSNILKSRKLKITEDNDYTQEDLDALKIDYEDYLLLYGNTAANASTISDLANLEAKYLGNLTKGITLIEDLLDQPGLKKKTKNQLKLDLGDIYILSGDVWESVLLYAQVNLDERDSPMGEDARFRNARLSYYNGEFEWAQAQLTILKGATTELIANDALNLSVFIIDNLGLDTTTEAMEMFADAELLVIQNKHTEATNKLNAILKKFPQHALSDDILYRKAKIASSIRNYEEAEKHLLALLMSYPKDILGDNATFDLAVIYENQLENLDKAKDYYEKIILDYSNSVLLVEARKRYRKLRGDKL